MGAIPKPVVSNVKKIQQSEKICIISPDAPELSVAIPDSIKGYFCIMLNA